MNISPISMKSFWILIIVPLLACSINAASHPSIEKIYVNGSSLGGGGNYSVTVNDFEIGDELTIKMNVENQGDDSPAHSNSVTYSFPSFGSSADKSRVSNSSGTSSDLEYFDAIGTVGGGDKYANYLMVEATDTNGWDGNDYASAENNIFEIKVKPKSLGTFYVFYRAAMNNGNGWSGTTSEEPSSSIHLDCLSIPAYQLKLTLIPPAKPDLRISSLSLSKSSGYPGDDVTIDSKTKNTGKAGTSWNKWLKVRYYLGRSSGELWKEIGWGWTPNLTELNGIGVNEEEADQITWEVPSDVSNGDYFITAVADADGDVTESNEGNDNKSSVAFRILKRTWTIAASADTGGSVSPNSRTVEEGDTTTFTVAPSAGYERGAVSGDGSGGQWSGNTYTTAKVTKDRSLKFGFEGVPDLRISSLSLSKSSGYPGDDVTIDSKTKNAGKAGTSWNKWLKVRYYLGRSSGELWKEIGWGWTPNLTELNGIGVNEEEADQITWEVPSDVSNGDYFITAVADADGDVTESNEGNDNKSSVAFKILKRTWTIAASADTGGSVSPNSRTVEEGDTTTFTVAPSAGYERGAVSGDGSGGRWSGNTYTTATVTKDRSLEFDFTGVPDLVVSSLVLSKSSGYPGDDITIESKTKNTGKAGSSWNKWFKVRYYLGRTSGELWQEIGWGWTPNLTEVNGIGVNEEESDKITWKIPSDVSVGDYFITAVADADGGVAEPNEGDDNKRSTPFRVKVSSVEVSLELIKYEKDEYNPIAVRWSIDGGSENGNPVNTEVPIDESIEIMAFASFPADPSFGVEELWYLDSLSFGIDSENLDLVRNQPRIESFEILKNGEMLTQGTTVPLDEEITVRVIVINPDPDNARNVRLNNFMIATARESSAAVTNQTSSSNTIPAGGGSGSFDMTFTPTAEGSFYGAMRVEAQYDGEWKTTDTTEEFTEVLFGAGDCVWNPATAIFLNTIYDDAGNDYGLWANLHDGYDYPPRINDFWFPEAVSQFILTDDPEDQNDFIDKAVYEKSELPSLMASMMGQYQQKLVSPFRGKQVKNDDGSIYYVPSTYLYSGLWELEWKINFNRKLGYKDSIRQALTLTGFPNDLASISVSGDDVVLPALPASLNAMIESMFSECVALLEANGHDMSTVTGFTEEAARAASDYHIDFMLSTIGKTIELLGEDEVKKTKIGKFKHYDKIKKAAGFLGAIGDFETGLSVAQRYASEMLLREYLRTSTDAIDRLEAIQAAYDYYSANEEKGDVALKNALVELANEMSTDMSQLESQLWAIFNATISDTTVTAAFDALMKSPLGEKMVARVVARASSSPNAAFKGLFGSAAKVTAWIGFAKDGVDRYQQDMGVRKRLSTFMTIHRMMASYGRFAKPEAIGEDVYLASVQHRDNVNLLISYMAYTLDMTMLENFNFTTEDWLGNAFDVGVGLVSFHASGGISVVMPIANSGLDFVNQVVAWNEDEVLNEYRDDAAGELEYLRGILERRDFYYSAGNKGFVIDHYLNCAGDDAPTPPTLKPFRVRAIDTVVLEPCSFTTRSFTAEGALGDEAISFTSDSDWVTISRESDLESSATISVPCGVAAGDYPVTVTASSDLDNRLSVEQTFIISVEVNIPPKFVLGSVPASEVSVGEEYAYYPEVFDPDQDSESSELAFRLENAPGWLSVDSQTGWVSGIPGTENVGTNTGIRLIVEDERGLEDELLFDVEVVTGCFSPTLDVEGALEVPQVGGDFVIQVTAGAGCSWETSTSESWIHLQDESQHTGSSAFSISVDPNSSPIVRSGTVEFGGTILQLFQEELINLSLDIPSSSQCDDESVSIEVTSNVAWELAVTRPDGGVETYTGDAGVHSVDYPAGRNTTATDRTFNCVLSGGGDSTQSSFTQIACGTPYQLQCAGGELDLTVVLAGQGSSPSSLGFQLELPSDWSFVSGPSDAAIKPNTGATSSELSWIWFSPFPEEGTEISITLSYPAEQTGDVTLAATMVASLEEMKLPDIKILGAQDCDGVSNPKFELVTDFPISIKNAAMSASDGILYVMGGMINGSSEGTTKIHEVDLVNLELKELAAELPYGMRWGLSSDTGGDGKIYLGPAGGPSSNNGWGTESKIVAFDPSILSAEKLTIGYTRNTWDTSATTGAEGEVYFFGGHTGSDIDSIYRLDPESGAFESVGNLPWVANDLHTVSDRNGGIYIVNIEHGKMAHFNTADGVVSILADLPSGYAGVSSLDIAWVDDAGDCFFVLRNMSSGDLEVLKYDASEELVSVTDIVAPSHLSGGVATRVGEVVYLFGADSSGLNKSYLYRIGAAVGNGVSPVAKAGLDQIVVDETGDCMVDVTFDGTGSTDEDDDIVSWTWSWTEGGKSKSVSGETASAELMIGEPEYEFAEVSGSTVVTLSVVDAKGNESTDTMTVSFRRSDTDDPVISAVANPFKESTLVSITHPDSRVEIYYTIDEEYPEISGILYEGPFEITETTLVQAIAYVDCHVPGLASKTVTKTVVSGDSWKPELADLENHGVTIGGGPVGELESWEFDGSSYLVGPSDSEVFGDTIPHAATIMTWFKTTAERGILFTPYDSSGYDGFYMASASMSDGKLAIGGRHEVAWTHVGWTITGETQVNDGEWHRLALVSDQASGIVSAYLDGALMGSSEISKTADYVDGGFLRFGASRFNGNPINDPFTGSLYGFEVVRSIMSLEEIEAKMKLPGDTNQAPVLAGIGDKSVNELSELSFTAVGSDADVPAQTLSYTLSGAPEGATIDSSNGAFSWTPTEGQGPGSYEFSVIVSDGALSDSETLTMTVSEVNVTPVLAGIGDKSVNELSELSFTAVGSDADVPTQTLSYSLSGAPEGATIDSSSGAFSWTPTESQGPDSYEFSVIVSDGELTDSETLTVTVKEVNVAPILAGIGDKSLDELSELSFTAVGSDADVPSQTLSYSLSGAPDGATIDSANGLFSWTPTEVQGPDSYEFSVIVSDGELTDSETLTVTVKEVENEPEPIQVVCGPAEVMGVPGGSLVLSYHYETLDADGHSDNAKLSGINIRIHFDSNVLSFASAENVADFGASTVRSVLGPFEDTEDSDEDASTDSYIQGTWVDIVGAWPNVDLPIALFDGFFSVSADAVVGSTTRLNITPVDLAEGYGFEACDTTVTIGLCCFDVDDDGKVTAFTDGFLIIRHLLSFPGDNLIKKMSIAGKRNTASEIRAFLEACESDYDVDGDGEVKAFTDGFLIVRYMLSFKGDQLIRNAIGKDATRTTASEIEAYLEEKIACP